MEQSNCRRMTGKVAIVTGAGQGFGRAIALRLAVEGADVIVDDIAIELANEVVDEIRSLGRKALATGADVTKHCEAEEMVKAALDEFGKIDILVNNVGGCEGGANFLEETEEYWDSIIRLSLKGTRNCSRAVINHMVERKSGKIVNISSGAGVRGVAGLTAYAAAKAGVIGFTMALAQEVQDYGIRVNCVTPGPSSAPGFSPPADMPAKKGHGFFSPELAERIANVNRLGRPGKPEDVAGVVALLASDEADFISGQNYVMCSMNP
jgi:NAD(P)-dependent dehydrogenase (short-subunit alcohol dehydrogenase family)